MMDLMPRHMLPLNMLHTERHPALSFTSLFLSCGAYGRFCYMLAVAFPEECMLVDLDHRSYCGPGNF